jgi:disulfide oxidoreductase YuzD
MPKTSIISIPDEVVEDLKAYYKQEYSHLSFNKMFVDITIREMKKNLKKEKR